MAANTAPIYSLLGDVQWSTVVVATANTAKDGTGTLGTDIYSVFTADATNGGYVPRIRWRSRGTNISTVSRVFINNGATNGTATNNILFDEITLTATTLSEVAALANYELPLGFALPAGFRILVTVGTTVAAGYSVSIPGGKY